MKRSRLFIGAACIALAFAGAVATKANTFLVPYYYIDAQDQNKCKLENIDDPNCSIDPAGGCLDASSRQLYKSKDSQGACQQALKFN